MSVSNALFTSLVDVSVPFALPSVVRWSDEELLGAQRVLADIGRRVDAAAASVAAEIAHRSRPDLGYEGLAQRLGARTPQRLVQRLTGATSRDAATLVRVGSLLPVDASGGSVSDPAAAGPAPIASERPWLAPVGAAVAAGRLPLAAADVIHAGLGEPDEGDGEVTTAALAAAAERLVAEALTLTIEQLAARARDARADLDAAGVVEREEQLRQRRYLHLFPQPDGMTRITGLLDPESATLVTSAIDAATSPRRGGPRFVDPTSIDRAEELVRDPRTTEQIAADTLVELIRIGSGVAPAELLGTRAPAVQLLVTDRDLIRRAGVARIQGQSAPVSVATAERYRCEGGAVPILFDHTGQVINLGRTARLFTRRQRLALAARDGGCRFPDCDRPPSWCEAHHIVPWENGGRTDIAHGVLLCRHHHLLLHNNGWQITREDGNYSVTPPRSIDPEQQPIPAPTRSGALRRLLTG